MNLGKYQRKKKKREGKCKIFTLFSYQNKIEGKKKHFFFLPFVWLSEKVLRKKKFVLNQNASKKVYKFTISFILYQNASKEFHKFAISFILD